jgi:RHS repeat-associated protein
MAAGYTYDAWGNILSSTGAMAASNPYRYAKYRYDSETGLYYLINRYYNPDIGRFISKEPFEVSSGDLPTINAYTYTQNNPVNAIDPDGNFLWFVAVGAYYAWSVYDSYRDVHTLRSTSASREDKAWAAIGLIGSVVPGGKAAKIIKKGSKTYKVLRHAKSIKTIQKGADYAKAISRLSPNKVRHILQAKHAWGRVAKDPNDWNAISKIISKTLRYGKESAYKSVRKKSLRYNGKIVEVTFTRINGEV